MVETAITELISRTEPDPELLRIRVSIFVERAGSADCETVSGQLAQVAPHSVTVLVTPPLDLAQIVSLRLRAAQPQFDLLLAADACSARALDPMRGALTCTLDPELPVDALAQFAVVDSHATTQPRNLRLVQANLSLAPDAPPSPVRVLSLIKTGIRFASPQTVQPGTPIALHFDTPDAARAVVSAQMKWQLKTDEGCIIGCQLESPDDARAARQAIRWLETHQRERTETPVTPSSRRSLRPRIVVAGITCALAVVAVLVLSPARTPVALPESTATAPAVAPRATESAPIEAITNSLSQLAGQVADHNRQLTELGRAQQAVQAEGHAEQQKTLQSQPSWQVQQVELADQLHQLTGSLSQLDQRLGAIERAQQSLLQRQRALANQLAVAAQITSIQHLPKVVGAVPAAEERHSAAVTGVPPQTTSATAGNAGATQPSRAAAQGNPREPVGPTPATIRTWSDSTGAHQVQAVLVSAAGGTVRLQLESGRVLQLPVARLSHSDQQFIAAWVRSRKQAATP